MTLLNSATELATMWCQMEAVQREYNLANGFTPAADGPSRAGQGQRHGAAIAQLLGVGRPTYSTPVKNMRAAEAAAAELSGLEGDELLQQQQHVRELITIANQQQAQFGAEHPAGSGSRSPSLPEGEQSLQHGHEASSMTPSAGRSNRHRGSRGHRDREQPAVDSRQDDLEVDGPRHPAWRPPLVHWVQPAFVAPAARLTIIDRLGPREPYDENVARHCIEQLARSLAVEEEDAIGPACFGLRIRYEAFPRGFTLPRNTPKYNGSVKPEDWLADYATAIGS